MEMTRRFFLGTAAGLAGSAICAKLPARSGAEQSKRRIPVIHATDLFRPYVDPDDHWDLASVFALAYRGEIDLKGVLIDHPPERAKGENPDVLAIAQLNAITGLSVPASVGTPLVLKSRMDIQRSASSDHGGIRMVHGILQESHEPVYIHVVGCARDIAVAGKMERELFAEKCAGIYLNAGVGSPDENLARKLEYNTSLDRIAYAAIFDLPCPVFWMPCFEELGTANARAVREYGTHYKFRQGEILPHLSGRMQNFFAYVLGQKSGSDWLTYLNGSKETELLEQQGKMFRSMWCTGGFLHSAGHLVSPDGELIPRDQRGSGSVFTFDPIRVECSDEGITRWSRDEKSRNRFLFHVKTIDRYQAAMTRALAGILKSLP